MAASAAYPSDGWRKQKVETSVASLQPAFLGGLLRRLSSGCQGPERGTVEDTGAGSRTGPKLASGRDRRKQLRFRKG